MKIKTIETIELSSKCDLACPYCINRLMSRHEIMDGDSFRASCKALQKLVEQGTQGKYLNINGNGETLLDPQLVARSQKLKEIIGPERVLQFSTNGIALTLRLAMDLKDAGVDKIELSPHNPMAAAMAAQILIRAGFDDTAVNLGVFIGPHEWAGQLRWLPLGTLVRIPCAPLLEGRIYIQSDGSVVPCCYDYQNLSRVGWIYEYNILECEVKPFELCRTCHQDPNYRIPEGMEPVPTAKGVMP